MANEIATAYPPSGAPKPVISDAVREELLRPLPRIRAYSIILALILIAGYLWGLNGTDSRPQEFVEGIPNIINFLVRLMPPAFELQLVNLPVIGPVSFPTVVIGDIIQTVQMAIIGSTISIVLAAPLGLMAARNTTPNAVIYQTVRLFLNMVRSIPELIWGLIFVVAVGLGPFAGVLALGIGSIGSLGKLYAESIEAIDPQQVLALRATGANSIQVFIYSVVPQALPLVASYALLNFEGNVRSATILGLVGAGGVGYRLSVYMALFQYHRLAGAVILLVILVTGIDRISAALRKRMI